METITLSEVEEIEECQTQAYLGLSPSVAEKLGEDLLLVGDERAHRAVSVGGVGEGEVVCYSGCFSLLAYDDFVGYMQYNMGLSLPVVKNLFTFEFLIERVVKCLEQAVPVDEDSEWEGEYVVDAVEGELRFRVWCAS